MESLPGSPRNDGHDGFGASASSYEPSPSNSNLNLDRDETPPQGTPGTEPMFNFRSLAAIITNENAKSDDENSPVHIENVSTEQQDAAGSSGHREDHEAKNESAKHTTPDVNQHGDASVIPEGSDPSNALGESVTTLKPTVGDDDDDEITPAPRVELVSNDHSSHLDSKHIGNISMVDSSMVDTRKHQHTQ